MAYPALTDLATFIAVLATGVLLPFLFSVTLRMRPKTVMFLQHKKQAMLSLAVFAVSFLATFGIARASFFYGAWRVSTGLVYRYIFHRSQSIVPSMIVHIFLVWGVLLFSLHL